MSAFPGESPAVEFIEHSPRSILTGTGRYMRELYLHLAPMVSIRQVATIDPPLTSLVSSLHHFPIGIQQHQAGSVVHFTQPLGSSVMLWNPVRPSIATVHDLSWLAWPPEIRMFRKIERLILYLSYVCLKRMDAVITVSDYTRRTVIERLGIPPERVFAIHSGNRPDQFKPVAGARAKLAAKYNCFDQGKSIYLLYVGNEFPRKNFAFLLEVLSLLPTNVCLLKVGAAGGQQFRAGTRLKIAELGLEDRVFFLGEVPEEELALFYNAADLYVCSSFFEGFCHPILEAMACGLPVVSSNAGSIPEIAGDAAILIPPSSAEVFADAVRMVLKNEGRREQMMARGLKRAESFSWEKTAKGVAEIYRLVATNVG